uniref:Retrotransposon Orf1 n=1 Tax=Tanacetum cinerariifolium TaxID=118510 RepID=A0A6L2IZR2_TANCI|nr:retrotransposon Orf1 [Tanacetum cinerariifolium]
MSWTGLPEFADDTITDYSRPSPCIESNSNDLQSSNSSVSENGESSSSILSKPMIKFVKAADCPGVIKNNETKTARKSPVKYVEMYRNTTKSLKVRGNQRNWNNLMNQRLASNFEFKNKACYKCGSFDHLIKDCSVHRKQEMEKPVWNNARRVNHQNSLRISHPNLKRYMAPRKNLTRSGPILFNTARQSHLNAVCCCCCSRQVNNARPKAVINQFNDVKASSCWVWKPIKPNTASITLKRYDYVDIRGRSRVVTMNSLRRRLLASNIESNNEVRSLRILASTMVHSESASGHDASATFIVKADIGNTDPKDSLHP